MNFLISDWSVGGDESGDCNKNDGIPGAEFEFGQNDDPPPNPQEEIG